MKPEARREIAARLSPTELEGGASAPRGQATPQPLAPPPAPPAAHVLQAVGPAAGSPVAAAGAPGQDPYAPAPLLGRRSVAPPALGVVGAGAAGAAERDVPPVSAPRSTLSLALIAGAVTVLVLSLITVVRVFASGAPVWPAPALQQDTVPPAERPAGTKPPSEAAKDKEPN
jgi:hypothetical protein